METNGVWSVEEQKLHINILELKACKLALMALCSNQRNMHIRLYTDNTTCCAYLNKFGGKSFELNILAREIWIWCIDKGIHLSAAHIAGVANVDADRLSRNFNDDLEWALDMSIFDQIVQICGLY